MRHQIDGVSLHTIPVEKGVRERAEIIRSASCDSCGSIGARSGPSRMLGGILRVASDELGQINSNQATDCRKMGPEPL